MRARMLCGWLMLALLVGCDDQPRPPDIQNSVTATQAPGSRGPTKEELLQGERKRINLNPLPLTIRVPLEWEIESLAGGTITVLQGPAPSGEAQIRLAVRPAVKKEEMEELIRGFQREMESEPEKIRRLELRDLQGATLMEVQSLGRPGPIVIIDERGHEKIETATSLSWTLTAFAEQEDGYARYELAFISLTLEQYQEDRELLEDIIGSLMYTGVVPAGEP